MNACANSPFFQFLDELIPIDLQLVQVEPEGVKMPCMSAVVLLRWNLKLFHVGERLVVGLGISGPGFDEGREFSELMNTYGRLQIGKVVFEPCAQHAVVPVPAVGVTIPSVLADAVEAKYPQRFRQFLVVGRHHTTLTGCQVLGGVKTEN